MDIGVLFIEDGRLQKMADYYSDSYDVPQEDAQQDWMVDHKSGKRKDNRIEMHFSRLINTSDREKVVNV